MRLKLGNIAGALKALEACEKDLLIDWEWIQGVGLDQDACRPSPGSPPFHFRRLSGGSAAQQ